uniref:Uncharacterized protein n=1 Tax=Arundo donax TaxID=35708 RepID=A0A0A9CA43_ARUDO
MVAEVKTLNTASNCGSTSYYSLVMGN